MKEKKGGNICDLLLRYERLSFFVGGGGGGGGGGGERRLINGTLCTHTLHPASYLWRVLF